MRPKTALYQELAASSSWAASVQVPFSICKHVSQQIALSDFLNPQIFVSSIFGHSAVCVWVVDCSDRRTMVSMVLLTPLPTPTPMTRQMLTRAWHTISTRVASVA